MFCVSFNNLTVLTGLAVLMESALYSELDPGKNDQGNIPQNTDLAQHIYSYAEIE
jgi:hypothetical protein